MTEAAPRLAHMSSTTFDSQLDLATKVAGDNPFFWLNYGTYLCASGRLDGERGGGRQA